MKWDQLFLQTEFFVGFFSNIFNILMTIAFILAGMILGLILSRYIMKPKNQVLYCREKDGRGEEYNIGNERAISLETATTPSLRFFKHGRAYEFRKRGRAFTRFFGKEGTAYTWILEGFSKVATKYQEIKELVPIEGNPDGTKMIEVTKKVPIEWEEKKLTLEFPTLEDAVKFRWGDDDYNRTPEELQAKLRDKKVLVTVNLEAGITPEGYQPITEEVINKEGDQAMAALLASEVKEASKLDWKMILIILGCGAGILAIVSKALSWW